MKTDPLTFLQLAAVVVIWWFALLAIAGKRLGMYHWVPVAICCFGIPFALADVLVQQPELVRWLSLTWHGLGLLLAVVYFARGVPGRVRARKPT